MITAVENIHFGMELIADGRRKVANDGFIESQSQGKILEFIGRMKDCQAVQGVH